MPLLDLVEGAQQFLICFGFVLFLVPTILCLVLWAKVGELRQHLLSLENRFGALAKDFVRSRIPTAPPAEMQAAIPLAPRAEQPAPPRHVVVPPPQPQERHTTVPTPGASQHPPAVPTSSERLRDKVEEVRQREHRPMPVVPEVVHARKPAVAAAAGKSVQAPRVPMAPATPPAKPAGKGFEAYIFTVGFVVLGAIILALAGIFLVKMGIERGVFDAKKRDIAAFIAGVALVGVGQWRRKFEGFWSQGAIAAGIVTLFATFFAATTLHHFMDPLYGFILLACTTAMAVGMSLQDWSGGKGDRKGGILIATLGLLGGFVTPILVNTGHDNVPGLFGYLILLHVGLVASTRMRGWSILAALSVIFSCVWLLLWVGLKPWNPADGPIYGMFMLAMVASLVITTVTQPEKWEGGKNGLAARALTWLAIGLGLLSSCLLIGKSEFSDLQWAFFACLVAGAFFLGRLRPVYEAMAWLAAFAVLAMLIAWRGADVSMPPQEHFVHWLTGFGAASVVAAHGCQWKSAVPMRWALLAVLLAVGYVGTAYMVIPTGRLVRPDEWAYLPLAAGVVLAAMAVPVFMRRGKMVTGEETLSVYAHGVLALLLMAPSMALTDGALTAAWCVLLPLTALAVWRLPALLIGFAVVTCVVVARGVMLGTVVEAGGEGRTLWWNPVVWSYGGALVAMAISAWILEHVEELPERLRGVVASPKAFAQAMYVGATAAAFMLFTLEVRWGFHDGKLNELSALLVERGTFAVGWLVMAAALVWMGEKLGKSVLVRSGEVVGVVGMVNAVGGLLVVTNPLWWGDNVGTWPVFNVLMFAYGVPAALCGVLAFVINRGGRGSAAVGSAAGVVGLVLLVAMVTLQVRQGYAGEYLGVARGDLSLVTFTEFATYSVIWMSLGAVCLALGMRFRKELVTRAGMMLSAGGLFYAVAVVGIFMSPVFHHQWVGDWPVVNHLLYAYGTPLVLAALAAFIVHPRSARIFGPTINDGDQVFSGWGLGRVMHAGIAVLLFILLSTEIRQAFQHAYLDAQEMSFIERGTYTVAWLLLAGGLLVAGYQAELQVARRAGLTIVVIAMAWVLVICSVVMNPLWVPQAVGGTRIFNWLLYHYGLPAAGTALLAIRMWRRGATEKALAWVAAIASLLLIFITVTLEVQQFFRGDHLAFGPGPTGEFTAYSLAWAGLGAIYLVLGIVRQSTIMRWASLAMMLLTILKVFLFDMQDLQEFERVLSFAGLGISLMALAFAYQRFVFRKAELPAEVGGV